MATGRVRGAAVLVSAAALVFAAGCSGSGSAGPPSVEEQNLNVAVVPALDSAGFFIALYDGLFKAEGLNVHFEPAISSETVIDQQALSTPGSKNELDITGGNYVSYIEAQQNWDRGERASASNSKIVAANLDIFAEGSVMQPGAQAIYTLPNSPIKSLSDLKGKTIGINAPDNILYLLAASVLAENGVSPSDVHFVSDIPLPNMAAALKSKAVDAAVLPDPFASAAQELDGAVALADLNQGATTSFPIEGYAVTKQWAQTHPKTLAAFYAALEQGQEIADTNRAAVQQAMEDLPGPLAVSKETAAIMTLDDYPVSTGPVGTVDSVRLQRVVDVMQQFLGFDPSFSIKSMLLNG
jgi:NitT/TauT family transport system substrate-binding protein